MCGIVGFVGHNLPEDKLLRAVRALRHRGPDGAGTFIEDRERVGLGHARLSIIDLQTGGQPLFSEDEDVVLVCNGEIYDFERLRSELEARGHAFRTRSDSEVILHLYQEHGLDFVEHLRGEFAFLLYDKHAQTLLAVRDRFGIKPLFLNRQGSNYVFASEAKAIFATGLLKPAIDVVAIRDYISGVIPVSIFRDIEVVPPGCMLKLDVKSGACETIRYWDLDLPADGHCPETMSLDEQVCAVREAVEEAIRLRLRADVPVGVYLSGGIDSSIVAATAAKYYPGTLKAFTIAFPDNETFNEYKLAKGMAEKIGAELHSVSCGPEALLHSTEDCLWASELPFPNFHGVGKFMLSRLAREHVKVVLTGEGSDETFLGYVYYQPRRGAVTDHILSPVRKRALFRGAHVDRIIEALGFVPLGEHAYAFSPRRQWLVRRMFRRGLRSQLESSHPLDALRRRMDRSQTDGRTVERRIQYFSIKMLLAPYLLCLLGDRAEMGHSIEGRTPFLDHSLFELARHIPDRFKIYKGVEKFVLREAFKKDLTDEIYQRKKWAYLAPPLWLQKGYSAKLDELFDRYLSKNAIEQCGIFEYRTICRLRWLVRIIFFDCQLKRLLNVVLLLCLTVQILGRQYVQDFEGSLEARMM